MPVPIAELFVSVGADISGATAGLNTLNSQLSRLGTSAANATRGFSLVNTSRQITNFGNNVQSAGRNVSQAFTLPILGAGLAAFKAGSDFEHSFTEVTRTVDGLDPTQLVVLRKALLDMSKTSAGGLKTASELAEIASVGGQVGIAGNEIEAFTSLVGRLSLATNLPFGEIADDIGRAINVMGLGSKDFEAFGSVITDLGNKFGGTERDILEFSRRLGGTLTALGVKPQQIEAIGAALSAAGILPEAGATAVNQFFVDMVNALNDTGKVSEETRIKLENMKDSIADLSNNLEVAVLRQKEFGRNTPASVVRANQLAIDKYKRELGEANTKLDNFSSSSADAKLTIGGMAKVAGKTDDEFRNLVKTDPARAFASFVEGLQQISKEQGPSGVTKTLEQLGITGDRQRETLLGLANAQQDVTSALNIADSAWSDQKALQTEVDTAMKDTQNQIKLTANQVQTTMIDAFDKQRDSIQKLIDKIDKDLIPALQRIGDAIPTFSEDQLKALGFLIALGPALIGIGVGASALGGLISPVGLAVIALVGLGFAFDDIANHWEDFKTKLDTQPQLRGITAAIDFVKAHGDEIKDALNNVLVEVRIWDTKLSGALSAAIIAAGQIFSAFGTFLDGFFKTVLLPVLDQFKGWIADKILGAIISLLQTLQSLGLSTLPGGADVGTTIAGLQATQANVAAGGGPAAAGAGGVSVTINNPQVTSQTLLDQLTTQVSAVVTNALVTAEQSVDSPPNLRLPGQPFFLPGGPF